MSKNHKIPKPKPTTIAADFNALGKLKISLGIIIAAFAFMLYVQSISFDYTLDDETVITGNNVTKKGLAAVPEILTTDYWHGYEQNLMVPQYRPFSMLLFAAEWQFFPNNPMMYHLINVLLYALTCMLLFTLLCKLLEKHLAGMGLLFSFVCTMLFAAHPVHTEVVDSIKSLDEIACLLFGILAIKLLFNYEEKHRKRDLITGCISYFCCLMSKESGITFLLLIPLVLFVFTAINKKQIGRIAFMLAGVSAIFFLIRSLVLASVSSSVFEFPLVQTLFNAPDVITQKATSVFILLKYILLLVCPYPLTSDYSFAQIPFHTFTDLTIILSIVIYLGMLVYGLLYIRKRTVLSFAILFYLITVAPVSNLLLLITVPMAERFMYIPSLAFCMALTYLLIKVTKSDGIKNQITTVGNMLTNYSKLFVMVSAILLFYSAITLVRNPDWKDNPTIERHDILVSNNSAKAHFNWGNTIINTLLPKEQNPDGQRKLQDAAIVEFNKTIAIYKNYTEAYYNLGLCYFNKEDYKNTIKNFEAAKALYHHPNAILYNNLANSYATIGEFDKALMHADTAIAINKEMEMAHINRGFILYKMGRMEDAIVENKEVLRLNPQNMEACKNIGSCYKSLNDTLKAKEYFKKANQMMSGQGR